MNNIFFCMWHNRSLPCFLRSQVIMGQLVDPTLKIFQDKVITHMWDQASIWVWDEKALVQLEVHQNKFIKKILGSCQAVSYLRMETGLPSIASKVNLALLGNYKKPESLPKSHLDKVCFFTLLIWESMDQSWCVYSKGIPYYVYRT